MVEKWKKDLDKISKTLKGINFEKILEDILSKKYDKYDIKPLNWLKYHYRIRVWKYRIVFKDEDWKEIQLIAIKSRWQAYRWLK